MQATGSGTEDLPPGWERHVDPGSGVAFYIDHATKRTTWEHPGTAAAPQAPHPLVQRTWALLSWLVGATHAELTTKGTGLLPRAVLLLDRWFEVRPDARKPVHGGRYIGLRAGEIEDWFARGPEAVLEEVRGLEVALRETYFAGSEHSAGLPGSNVGGWVYFAGPAGQEEGEEEPVILDGTARPLATLLQFPCAIPFQEVLRHFFYRPARRLPTVDSGRVARPFQPSVGRLVDAPGETGGADADNLLSAVANNDKACLIWGDTVGDVEVSRSIDFGRLLADDDGGAAEGVGELRFRQLEVRNAGTGAVFLLSIRPSNSLFVLQDDHGLLVSTDSQGRPDKAVRLGPGDVYPVTVILNAAKPREECGCLTTTVLFSFFAAGAATLHGLRTRGIPHVHSRGEGGDGASFCIARTVLATVVPTHLEATFQLDVDAKPFVGRELREQWTRSPSKVETAPPLGMDAYHDARAVSRPRRCGEKRGLRRAGLTRGRAESRQHLGPRICIAGSCRAAGATLGPAADLGERGAARAAEAVRPLQRGRQRLAAEQSRDCIPRLGARQRAPALLRAAAWD